MLDSRDGSAIRSVDALALFHIAEHILFADEVIVSSFEPDPVLERTAGVLTKLEGLGVASEGGPDPSLLRLEPFNEKEHLSACENAGIEILAELVGLSASQLTELGRLADEAVRPEGVPPLALDSWLSDAQFLDDSAERTAHLISLQAIGAFELTVLKCPLLFELLQSWVKSNGILNTHAAAIGVIMRIHINQELARFRTARYAPAPQRTRISHVVDGLFRHRLERRIQEEVRLTGRGELQHVLSLLTGPELLPLPLLTFHAFRGKRLGSPIAILETARVMRDDPEIRLVRKWLAELEQRHSDGPSGKSDTALAEINRLASDATTRLKGKRDAGFWERCCKILRAVLTVEGNLYTGSVKWSPPAEEIIELFAQRNQRQHRFLAVVAEEFATDEHLGGAILEQLGRLLEG